MEGLGYLQASRNTFLPILFALPLRIYLFRRNTLKIRTPDSTQGVALYSLPWREFIADLAIWLLIGGFMAVFYVLHLQAPFLTGLKIFLGSVSFGLFGGMLCYLSAEKRIMDFLKEAKVVSGSNPKKLLSVSKKMLFLVITVLFFMVIVMLLMFFMDLNYMLTHRNSLDPSIYYGVFKEILFAFVVLLLLSVSILGQYSRNLKATLALQLDVMEDIGRGNYDTRIPVVSNDEFGLIAAKTNEMISGLKEREACEISFGRYVTPEVSEKILKGEIPGEGELREATILFCDLRGYTTLVEESEPRAVVRFLNEYFTEMDKTIKEHKGIVLQYIGDEIEAVFGAPEDLPNHAEMAVMAALAMRRRLKELNNRRESMGRAPVAHGIGIHSGKVLAGSVGSPERLVYAMVGDTVNTASRIQDLNKTFGTDILLSQVTRDFMKGNDIPVSSLGKVALRGKSVEMELFKVL
jgi:adenylate cyclase